MSAPNRSILAFTIVAVTAACAATVLPSSNNDDGAGGSGAGAQSSNQAQGGNGVGGSNAQGGSSLGGSGAQGGSSRGGAGGSADTCDNPPAVIGDFEVCGGGGTSSSGTGGTCEVECHDEGSQVWQVSCNGSNCACIYDGETLCTCQATDSFCGEICCPDPWKSMGTASGTGGAGPGPVTVSTTNGVGGGSSSVSTTSGGT